MKNKLWFTAGAVVTVLSISLLIFETVMTSPDSHHNISAHHEHSDTGHDHDTRRLSDTEPLLSHQAQSQAPTRLAAVNYSDIAPIPTQLNIDRNLAKIGWVLFRDPNLSSNKAVSCETCHQLQTNGAEHIEVSTGVKGKGFRNSLTVYNTAFNYRFFWDGRVNNLHDQLDGPIHNVVEMDSNWPQVETYVKRSQHYNDLFDKADIVISTETIKHALVEFMTSLTTPHSPFDRYLLGDETAMTEQQIRGWNTFQDQGCARCHRGTNIGGGMVINFGFFGDDTRGANRSTDTGRHMNTGKREDLFLFRVASLRNVADTAPYFHDGRTQTLEEAISIMAKSQLGRSFSPETVQDIKAFLTALSAPRPAILKELEDGQN